MPSYTNFFWATIFILYDSLEFSTGACPTPSGLEIGKTHHCAVQCSLALPGLPHTQSYSGLHSMLRVDLNKLLNWNRISQNAQLEIQELFYNYSLLALWAAGLVKCRNALGRVDWQPPPSSHGIPYKLIEVLLCTQVSRITKCGDFEPSTCGYPIMLW